MTRVLWIGLGAFAVMASGFVWVVRRALAVEADLAADDAERGPEPIPAGGRHRRGRRSFTG